MQKEEVIEKFKKKEINWETIADFIHQLQKKPKPKNPEKVKGAIKEFQEDPEVIKVLACVAQDVQERWLRTYQDSKWINQELLKAVNYYSIHSNKTPRSARGWSHSLTTWLSRGFEYKRRGDVRSPRRKGIGEILGGNE